MRSLCSSKTGTSCALLFTALLSSLWSPSGWAEPKIHDPVLANLEQRSEQRELFVKAEYAAKRGRLAEYQQLLEQLEDYPLTPYLELERPASGLSRQRRTGLTLFQRHAENAARLAIAFTMVGLLSS